MRYYKTVNLQPEAFADLQKLAQLITPAYASANLGAIVAKLIADKLKEEPLKN